MTRLLDGVTVLDLTRLLPGAVCTLMLADLGAEVVKVEDPRGGDPLRRLPPLSGTVSVYHRLFNRNKRSVALDLRASGARGVLDALVDRTDVVVESFRPETARRLGVDAATLRARHPRLVHCAITGFGQTGPYADRAAHDLNFVALAGLLALEQDSLDEPPRLPRLLIADIAGGAMSAAVGILAALVARARTGEGASLDLSMHEGALAWLAFPAARWLVEGGVFDPRDLPVTGREAWYNVYRTADGRYLAVGAIESKFWAEFCRRIGRPDLIDRQHASGEAQARLVEEVAAVVATRTRDEWLQVFAGADACVTPVNTVEEALADPQVAARGVVVAAGGLRVIRSPIRLAGRPGPPAGEGPRPDGAGAGMGPAEADGRTPSGLEPACVFREAPALGADTDTVLEQVGIGPAARARLRADGVIA